MVVVVITASGAILALYAYNNLKASSPDLLEDVLFRIQQQAGVMASICAAIFGIITALKTGKLAGLPSASAMASSVTPPSGSWGKRAAELVT